MKEKKLVSVIIPNYNGKRFLIHCLQSLEKQTITDYEIIVIDNASKDGSIDYVIQEFPNVVVEVLDKNYGFSKAVNEGIKKSNSKYVILLNNDTKVQENFIEELVKVMETSSRIFSCQSKLLQLYDKEYIDDAGDFYCALGWAFARGKGKPASFYEKEGQVFAACAGAAIYRKEVFEQIGYFDEAHFAYLEDIDIGYRAKIHGYQNRYAPKSIVFHAGSASSGSRYNAFKIELAARNSVYLIYKNMPLLQIILNLPFIMVGYIIKTAFFVKKGYGKTYLTGLLKGVQLCMETKKSKFQPELLRNYALIQLELWLNLFRRIFY